MKLKEEDIVDTVSVVQFLKLTKMYRKIYADADQAMEIISRRLIEESQDRDWCDEFDNIIEEVNEKLPSRFQLDTRERNYNITWTETYTVTIQRHANLDATSADVAGELADDLRGEASNHDLEEAIRNGDFEYEEADDYEIELN